VDEGGESSASADFAPPEYHGIPRV